MGFLDRAKEAAQRAKSGARVAREQGQQRIEDLQARRQAEVLLREVGLAAYEEHRGEGGHEAVVRAVAKLDEHVRAYNIDLSTSGIRGYLRTAAGAATDENNHRDPQPKSPEGDEETASKPAEAEPAEANGSAAGAKDTKATDAGDTEPAEADDTQAAKNTDAPGESAKPAKKAAKKPTAAKSTAAKKTATKKTSAAKKSTTKKSTTKKAQPALDDKPTD